MNLEKLYYYRKQEKHYTAKILEQLLSVWKSKTYLKMGYSTIYKFLVQHLHYSEHEANARIAALQLMKRSVVAAKEVSEGKISPSSARVIEQHLKEKEKTTKLTKENVAEIVQSVSTLSMRKTDQKLQLMLQTKARKTQVLYIHENLQLKLDRVKRQYDVDLSNSELIEILLEEKLKSPMLKKQVERKLNNPVWKKQIEEKLKNPVWKKQVEEKLKNPVLKKQTEENLKSLEMKKESKNKLFESSDNSSKVKKKLFASDLSKINKDRDKNQENRNLKMDKKQCKKKLVKTRYISKNIRQEVWLRSQGMCEYPSCKERRNLEYDHIVPYSKNGPNSLENIQLLCRAHNQEKSDSIA